MRKSRRDRLVAGAAALTEHQLAAVFSIAEGKAALLGRFAVRRTPHGWSMCGLDDTSEPHIVLADLSACSCPDNRYRKHECKHMKALRRWLHETSK